MSNTIIVILIGVGLCFLGIGLFLGGVLANQTYWVNKKREGLLVEEQERVIQEFMDTDLEQLHNGIKDINI